MHKVRNILILCWGILCWNCSPDTQTPVGTCFSWDDFPVCKEQFPSWENFIFGPDQYFSPCYNPQNLQEFCYLESIDVNNYITSTLKVYNMATGTSKSIFTGNIFSRPDWGKTGWITFGSQAQIWKIRPDGSELTKLTFHPENYRPFWNFYGDRIIYQHLRNGGGNFFIIMMDADGNNIDTLDNVNHEDGRYMSGGCHSGGNQHVYFNEKYRGIRFVSEDSLADVAALPFNSTVYQSEDPIRDIDYNALTSVFYWCDSKGIWRTTTYPGIQHTLIKESCDAVQYFSVSISPNGVDILTGAKHYKELENCYFQHNNEIRKMHYDGSDEIILKVD